MKMHIRLILIVVLSWSWPCHADLFGPSNYDECILDSMKGVTSDVAAEAITRSCRTKFPATKQADAEVPEAVIWQLDGRAGMGYNGLSGNIYNGNREWTITQITIVLIPKTKDKPKDLLLGAKEYNVDVLVLPLTNSSFGVSVNSG